MKTNKKVKFKMLRWLALILLISGGTSLMAQSTVDPDHACEGATENYWVVDSPGSTYLWVVSGGGAITTGQGSSAIQVNWTTAGNWTVTVTETLTSTTGCAGDPVVLNVIVDPLPTPVISGLNVVCQDQTGVTYSTPDVPGNTYAWVVTGGTITAGAGTNQITVTWTSPGLGNVQVTETVTATNCSQVANLPVNVNPVPTPVITGLNVVCEAQAGVTYSTPNVIGNTYAWVVTGGTITAGAGTNQITVTWTTPGAGSVQVTETVGTTGCAEVATLPVTVNPLPAPVITGLNVVCEGQAGVTYSTPDVVGNTYAWVVTGGTITGGAGTNQITVTWTTPGPGNVEVTETITATGCLVTTNIPVTVNPLPAPVITGLNVVCEGQAGVTYSTPNVIGNTYAWVVTGGTITAGAGTNQITVTWTTPGLGNVEVTETVAATGCTVTTNIPVTVNPLPAPVITGLNVVCEGQTGVTYSTPDVPGNTYAWVVTGGTITGGAGTNQITVTWTTPGLGNVEVTETITATGCLVTTNIPVTVNPLPAPVITGLNVVCEGQTGVTYSTPNVVGNTYAWVVTGGTITAGAGTNQITVTWTTPGLGNVEVTETVTATGCTVTTNIPVTVNPLPAPVITGLNVVCEGQTGVTYSTPNVVGNTYAWVVTGGTITAGAGTNQITVTWTTPGLGNVEVTETITATSCTVTTNIPVTVNPLPTPAIVGLDVVCEGQAGVIYSTPNVVGNTYAWVVTGGTITGGAGTNQITVTWTTPGLGNVEVTETITATGCTVTTNIPVTVNPLPAPLITGSNVVCEGQIGVTYSTPNVIGNTYVWTVTGGNITAGAGTNQITVTWTTPGAGSVQVVETVGATGCNQIATLPVTVNPKPATSPIWHN